MTVQPDEVRSVKPRAAPGGARQTRKGRHSGRNDRHSDDAGAFAQVRRPDLVPLGRARGHPTKGGCQK
jgi:hypothetical protein